MDQRIESKVVSRLKVSGVFNVKEVFDVFDIYSGAFENQKCLENPFHELTFSMPWK